MAETMGALIGATTPVPLATQLCTVLHSVRCYECATSPALALGLVLGLGRRLHTGALLRWGFLDRRRGMLSLTLKDLPESLPTLRHLFDDPTEGQG